MAESEPLSAVVGTGGRRASLEALRDVLALTIEQAEPREVAALARQLTIVLEQLDAMPAEKGASSFDDLAGRRRARKSATAAQ